MTYAGPIPSSSKNASVCRPFIESYDLGYEFSQQHYLALECMVEDGDEEATFAHVPHAEQVAA